MTEQATELTTEHDDQATEGQAAPGLPLGDAILLDPNPPGEPIRAALVGEDGAVTAVVLVHRETVQAGWLPDGAAEILELDDDEDPVPGARWDGQAWTEPDAPPAPQQPDEPVDPLRRDVDALLGLLLTAQSGGPVPDVDWHAILAGMVQRGTAGEHELRGAHGWGLLEADDVEALLAAEPPAAAGA